MATGTEPLFAKVSWPFFIAATAGTGAKLNLGKLAEALIIAAVTAGGTTYTMTKVTETRVVALEDDLRNLHEDIREMRSIIIQSHFPQGSGKQ